MRQRIALKEFNARQPLFDLSTRIAALKNGTSRHEPFALLRDAAPLAKTYASDIDGGQILKRLCLLRPEDVPALDSERTLDRHSFQTFAGTAVALLFRRAHRLHTHDQAISTAAFMSDRAKNGLRLPQKIFMMSHPDIVDVDYQWPLNWVVLAELPNFMTYMLDRNSVLLPDALKILPDRIARCLKQQEEDPRMLSNIPGRIRSLLAMQPDDHPQSAEIDLALNGLTDLYEGQKAAIRRRIDTLRVTWS